MIPAVELLHMSGELIILSSYLQNIRVNQY